MRNTIILFSLLFLCGCNIKENKKRILEQHKKDSLYQAKRNDSIQFKKIEDLTLISKFKKWINEESHDTTFINPFFENDIIESSDQSNIKLKPKADILSLIIKKSIDNRFEHGFWIHLDILRSDCNDLNFTREEFNMYNVSFPYFKLTITDSNNKTISQVFKHNPMNEDYDEGLLKTISDNINDKIQVEEFFAREDVGHFEGEKKPEDKRVRSFYLTDKNKQAIKESYMLFLLLDK